jgi:hypothetical protein
MERSVEGAFDDALEGPVLALVFGVHVGVLLRIDLAKPERLRTKALVQKRT